MADYPDSTSQPRPDDDIASLSAEARALIALITRTDISELELAKGDTRIVIKRSLPPTPAPQFMPMQMQMHSGIPMQQADAAPAPVPGPAAAAAAAAEANSHLYAILAPMVGTFYSAASPTDKPYVSEGDIVEQGQTIGLIEAMKMMNEIEADRSGRVVRVAVENGKPVEYGQPLVLIEPDAT